MVFQKKKFIPYNELSIDTIIKVANNLGNVGKKKLKESALQFFLDYSGEDAPTRLPSCSVEMIPLFDISNAIVLISFKRHPFRNSALEGIGGLARIIIESRQHFPIPVIYLMPNHSDDTLEHEKVHICQYLQPGGFPLTKGQKELILSKNFKDNIHYLKKTKGIETATDFVVNATCYKTWTEMEANYVTIKPDDTFTWMMKVYVSAQTIICFNEAAKILGWQEEIYSVKSRFETFCKIMESEIDWVKEIVHRSQATSLEELILIIHDEYETDLMFGPIEIE